MRILLLVLISVHGLIHLAGFMKAFNLAPMPGLPHPISKVSGVLWLTAACLIMTCGVLFYTRVSGWWITGIVSIIISEYVIIKDWKDARLGTVLNILILAMSIIGFALWYVNGLI